MSAGLTLAAVCLIAAGCGAPKVETEVPRIQALEEAIVQNLPKGWQIGRAGVSGVAFTAPTQPDDILVWKTEKVVLRKRGAMVGEEAPAPVPVHVYFTLSIRPFIAPEAYAGVRASNAAIKVNHDYWLKTVANIPRNSSGEFITRGDEEGERVGLFKKNYAELPPYDADLPTHHFEGIAFKLRDWRAVQEPEDRPAQTEMNTAYVAITKPLTPYHR
jgi:hypothetical protein